MARAGAVLSFWSKVFLNALNFRYLALVANQFH